MAGSTVYQDYIECAAYLRGFGLETLQRREEKTAFWINLFNVLVIRGVIALGIRNSVKEILRFFRSILCRIGDFSFSADDIEHGILRANHRLPNSWPRPFGSSDLRSDLIADEVDPRIHFALVCASSSCPPIARCTRPKTSMPSSRFRGRPF